MSDDRSTPPPTPSPANPAARAHQLHAPWRSSYMKMLANQQAPTVEQGEPSGGGDPKKAACFLEEHWKNPDRDASNHVIVRTGTPGTGSGGMVMLNRYPYANGHLLVALGEGRPRLLEYTESQRRELWSLVDLAVELCELSPQGVNVGVNQGAAAGAGIPEHLHAHVVPRWSGDVNFITAVAQIRVIPSALEEMYGRYVETWERVRETVMGDG